MAMNTRTLEYESASASHKGMLRDHNEDSFLVDPALGLYIVADGMGGHQAGDVASKLCVEAVHRKLRQALETPVDDAGALGKLVLDALNQANESIRRSPGFDRQKPNMGTTIALVLTRGDTAIIAHVGDSRVYRLRGDAFQPLTRDHSFLQAQVGSGFVSQDEARLSHNRNLVTRALGMDESVAADIGHSRVSSGDVFLLCTDGLNTMVSDEDIKLVLSELRENPDLTCRMLVEVANDNGGHDNVTVALLKANDVLFAAPPPSLWRRLFGWLFKGRR